MWPGFGDIFVSSTGSSTAAKATMDAEETPIGYEP